MVRNEIKRLEAPTLHCAKLVSTIMHENIETSMNSALVFPTVSRFPALKRAIVEIAEEMILSRTVMANGKIQDYIEILSTFIKTKNSGFSKLLDESVVNMDVRKPYLPSKMILNGPFSRKLRKNFRLNFKY